MKKIIKIVSIPILIVLILILYISYLTNNNQNYLDNITKNIKTNYKTDEEITYSNYYNNYYIFTTKSNVIVLNNEYQEVLKESIGAIQNRNKDQELIYKTGKLMFEEVSLNKSNITYTYYDASNNELIKETTLEKK